MSVRKREWISPRGETKEAWAVDYRDAGGKRRHKTFKRKKDADEFAKRSGVEVMDGVHVADGETVTVAAAGKLWMKSGEAARLERTTMDQRRQHLELHIVPFIGETRLNKTSVPWVRAFQDQLREAGRSPAMVKRATVSLGSIIADAQGRGLATRNPVHERSRARSASAPDKRAKPARLTIGVDIPSREEVKAFVTALPGRWRPLLVTAIFTGMRSSELRGLTWANVDLVGKTIRVSQRADAYNEIGRPKSEAGDRTIPIPPVVANALREWMLACPRRDTGKRDADGEPIKDLHWVFPNGAGKIESHANIVNRGLVPSMIAADVVVDTGRKDDEGQPVMAAKYTGLHSLRHFYASWCINPITAGGQGLTPKVVQERLGHGSIQMTLDTYGHLFPRGDDDTQLAAAAAALLG